MAADASPDVAGRRLLVVEDDYWIASDLVAWLESQGAEVLGPAGSVGDALGLLSANPAPDAAVLDINLGEERVYPVADALIAAQVPFVFLSGYDSAMIPNAYRHVACCAKPVDRPRLLRMIGAATA